MNHWIEVSGERLRGNLEVLRSVAGDDVALLAVIKANAYGHGAAAVAPVLVEAGAAWLGVTDAEEGAMVRTALRNAASQRVSGPAGQPSGVVQIAGFAEPSILVMSGLVADEAAVVVEQGLTPVAWSVEQLAWLEAAGRTAGRVVPVHVEVDTGMSRQGAGVGAELAAALRFFAESRWVKMEGLFTHFASAEVSGAEQTAEQRVGFEAAVRQVAESGLRVEWVHAGNSSLVDEGALLGWLRRLAASVGARAMVRPGIALYGYCLPLEALHAAGPFADVASSAPKSRVRGELKPVMTWKARVTGLREIAAGTRIGYGGTFVAAKAMRVALLPVGYADGLRRELSATADAPGGWVMLHGRRAAIVGRVSMNLTVVDVTGIDDVKLGDEAVVLGAGVSAEDHAALAGTLAYEILCGVRGEIVLV